MLKIRPFLKCPLSATVNFTTYSSGSFGRNDQVELARVTRRDECFLTMTGRACSGKGLIKNNKGCRSWTIERIVW